MDRIQSFSINHDTLDRGIYISRVDSDIVTYDLRFKKPNNGDYLGNKAMHTIEHLFATYVRNSEFKDNIIYFGPMGCRTGFYFLIRSLESSIVIDLIIKALMFIKAFEGEVPGAKRIECGNYLEHDITLAKKEASDFLEAVKNYRTEDLKYKE